MEDAAGDAGVWMPGGWMTGARLVGGTVRRRAGPHTPFVHELLGYLHAAGFSGTPQVVGVEGDDEVLTYLDGHVPVEVEPDGIDPVVFSDRGIGSAFRLIRTYHDIVAASPLTRGREVVCHGDLSPWNTVYAPDGAVALIDWDGARPGDRLEDVGHAVWRYLMLGFDAAPPLPDQRRYLRTAADAYGLWPPPVLLDAAARAQARERAGFERRHAAGDPAITRLVALGALDIITGAQAWLTTNRRALLANDDTDHGT